MFSKSLISKENISFSRRAMQCTSSAKDILETSLSTHISVSRLARKVGLNSKTLGDCFKYVYGSSIFVYGQHLRLENGKKLLRETDLTIQVIAEECGYREQSNFGTAFHRKYGVGPAQWRKENVIFAVFSKNT
ncbi:MAG TPA: AraC family transcriptional regulator [Puia sp.]|jgi:AraC-like DNA-binding protein|nr:AraC family transcriptional regulator [Puia sp.]